MNELHGNRAFVHARCNPFHRTVADVPRGKDAGNAGFHPMRVALQLPSLRPFSFAHQVRSSKDESSLVTLHHAGEPFRVGLSANENRQ